MCWYFIRFFYLLHISILNLVPSFKVFKMWDATVDRSKVSMSMVWFDRPRILLLRSDSPTAASKGQSKWTQAGAQSHMLVGGSPCSSTPSAPFISKTQYEIIYFLKNTLSSVSLNSGQSINWILRFMRKYLRFRSLQLKLWFSFFPFQICNFKALRIY